MNLFGWWKKKKAYIKGNLQQDKEDQDICPVCNGQGYRIDDNHFFTDCDDYERHYLCCRRCEGTGRYHKNRDDY